MPALPPPLLLTLVLCAIVAMAVIGTVHADSPAKLQYWEQMKAMMQAADGARSDSAPGHTPPRPLPVWARPQGAGYIQTRLVTSLMLS